jgi:hypothetical protein
MKCRAQDRGGFTLLEIVVAAAVGVLVVGGALTVVVNALAWHERIGGSQQARAEARRVLDRVAADLAALQRREGGAPGLVATMADGVGVSGFWEPAARGQPAGAVNVGEGPVAAMRFGIGGVWLRFAAQVPASESDGGTQPRVIAYQIIRRRAPGAAAARYWLHRTVVRAGRQEDRPGTWETGWNLDPTADTGFMHPTARNDGSVAGDPHSVVRPEAVENLLAGDVVDFGVRFLEETSDAAWRVLFPVDASDRDFLAPAIDHYPAAADLLVRVLTPEGARRLAAFENDGEPGPGWWGVMAANSEVLTRRIHLLGGRP